MIELLLIWLLAQDPTCLAEEHEFLKWGAPNAGAVVSDPVSPGETWLVRGAGVFGNNPAGGEYMIELRVMAGSVCCFHIPVARSQGPMNGTPYLALGRPLVLHEGDRLASRVNGLQWNRQIGFNMTYYSLPAHCLPLLE